MVCVGVGVVSGCLLFVVVCVFRGCHTGKLFVMKCYYYCLRVLSSDFIYVDLPSSTYPTLTYRLDIDPIDRNYVCFNTDDNTTNTTWNDENLNTVHLLDIYSFYETDKKIGMKEFACYNIANEFVGVMMVNIQGM